MLDVRKRGKSSDNKELKEIGEKVSENNVEDKEEVNSKKKP